MRALRLMLILTLPPVLQAQQAIGTVAMQDATVSGSLSVTEGRAVLVGSSSVVAKDHTAEIALNRGGSVRVCATSGLHLTQSQAMGSQPLMLALDRGAIEVQTAALANDVVMTPDLRFAIRAAGPLDLRLRVTRNGDTCVENKGATAPVLGITDQFGEASYELRPNQHVLFEHGSLKEVVDNESSPCGCPAPLPGMSIADAILAPPGSTGSDPKAEAAAQHPFPAAISQGLAPSPAVPQAPVGVVHDQVTATLGFNGDGSGNISGTPAVPSAAAPAAPPAPPPPAGFGQRLGHFFKHLFGGN
jgi:hypothetical protein